MVSILFSMKAIFRACAPLRLMGCCFILAGRASAQIPGTLLHAIPPPPVGAQDNARLGHCMAVEGNYTISGIPFDSTGAGGSGQVKVHDSTTGALLFVLPNPVPKNDARFGWSVAISGTRLVVGASRDDAEAWRAGRAFVYDLAGGTPTVPILTLQNPAPLAGGQFGYAVAISGTRVVVGAPAEFFDSENPGRAWVYDLAGAAPAVPVAALSNPEPAAGDQFGAAVAISGTRVIVGAPYNDQGATNAGSACVFDLAGTTPATPIFTLNNPEPGADDYFGESVAISASRAVVGAYGDKTGAYNAGAAYVYDLARATPAVPGTTLYNPAPVTGWGYFGGSVAISGTRVAVGPPSDHTAAYAAGSVYIFELSGGTPAVPVFTINNPGAASGSFFGGSVALSGSTLAAGAPYDDTEAFDGGRALCSIWQGARLEFPWSRLMTLARQQETDLATPSPCPAAAWLSALAARNCRVIKMEALMCMTSAARLPLVW